jgi:2-iminobutanoate/2-iminopropanoate deaminase
MNKRAITGLPVAASFSPAIVAEGPLLFVSGQVAMRDGEVVSGSIEEETELAIDNLQTVLRAGGAELSDVVRCGVFLADLGDFAGMDAVYKRIFPEPLPARTTVGVALPGFKIEIDCVALLRS